ncbi:MAG TPA: alpha/beta hydrolase [Planctomycetes bacterium]|nr:alpha/beta hydrolase [Planctomycetota bacterium]
MAELPTKSGRIAVGDGLELYYESRGVLDGAETVVVVPSLSWLAKDMDALVPERAVVFYDIRGRGRSSAILEDDHLGLEKDVEDLELLRAGLGIERMALLGWSYHGALAARYALAHPERVERMLLVGPTAPAESPYWMDFLERFGRRCKVSALREVEDLKRAGVKESDPHRYAEAVHRVFFLAYVTDPAVLDTMRSSPCVEPNLDADRVNDQGRRLLEKLGPYDWREEFRGFPVPTLLLHGLEDPVEPEGTKLWHELLADSRLELWDGVGHMPWLEVPERFFALANEFLG